jgi:hypothetical protein
LSRKSFSRCFSGDPFDERVAVLRSLNGLSTAKWYCPAGE